MVYGEEREIKRLKTHSPGKGKNGSLKEVGY
jgi:hypothetical protein